MVQNPKNGGLSSSFGGGGQLGGVQKTTDFLEKSTWVLGGALIVLILLSTLSTSSGNSGSKLVEDAASKPAPVPTTAPANAPASKPAADPAK